MANELLSTAQVAELLQCTQRYVQTLCERGFFKEYAFKIGKRWRVTGWYVREVFHLDKTA